MKKENVIETLGSIGIFVIIIVWFLVVHKLYAHMDTVLEQGNKNMSDIYAMSIQYDEKIADLKATINKQQSTINQLSERITELENSNKTKYVHTNSDVMEENN